MNKMFTAIATLQLVEAGKLALDDPIGKHLPIIRTRMWPRRSPYGICSRIPGAPATSSVRSTSKTA